MGSVGCPRTSFGCSLCWLEHRRHIRRGLNPWRKNSAVVEVVLTVPCPLVHRPSCRQAFGWKRRSCWRRCHDWKFQWSRHKFEVRGWASASSDPHQQNDDDQNNGKTNVKHRSRCEHTRFVFGRIFWVGICRIRPSIVIGVGAAQGVLGGCPEDFRTIV